jgi:hypothetical protein
MATLWIPFTSEQDFEAFKRILGRNLPDTYDGWRQLVTDRADRHLEVRQQVVIKEADPNEFAEWLTATGREATLNALDTFVFQQATRVKDE